MINRRILLLGLLLSASGPSLLASEIPGFRKSAWFGEQVREQWFGEGIRVLVNAPGDFDGKKPTRIIFFATPNGNSLEQTMGCITQGTMRTNTGTNSSPGSRNKNRIGLS